MLQAHNGQESVNVTCPRYCREDLSDLSSYESTSVDAAQSLLTGMTMTRMQPILFSTTTFGMMNVFLLLSVLLSEEMDVVSANSMHLIDPEYCESSKQTRNVVESCPTDEKSWMEAAENKKCEYTQGCLHTMEYHCLINPWGNLTVEVCTPVAKILPGYCAEYNDVGGKVQEHYMQNCEECTNMYMSNKAYKYLSRKRAEAKAAKAKIQYAIMELELRKKQAEIEAELEVLNLQREAEEAEAE
ncbi:uncharacterized protein LOC134278681, partial [Saccostrea cucullata]|uniref:uncharacterized protein LOC134278681 n=1 Tax=Saccostrea cuccullata TaxID=36930 RepID=UPI002ED493E4